MTASRRNRQATSVWRRSISVGTRPGVSTWVGLGREHGWPLLLLEEGEATTIRLDYRRALPVGGVLQGFTLQRRNCEACLVFDEQIAALIVWGSRPWFGDAYGYDYDMDRHDGVEVRASLPDGEVLVERIIVRAPNKPMGWRSRGWGGDASGVIDQRSAAIYGDTETTDLLSLIKSGSMTDGRIYVSTLFGPLFGPGFGS